MNAPRATIRMVRGLGDWLVESPPGFVLFAQGGPEHFIATKSREQAEAVRGAAVLVPCIAHGCECREEISTFEDEEGGAR